MAKIDIDPSLWATAIELIEEIRDKAAGTGTTPITSLDLTSQERRDAFEKLKIYFKFSEKSKEMLLGNNIRTGMKRESQKDFPIALKGNWKDVLEHLKQLEEDRKEPYKTTE